MTHYLYRPHIHIDDKIVTIDFLIRSASIADRDSSFALPVDLLHSQVEMQFSPDNSLVAPASFQFVGDDSRFEAPALCLIDRVLFEQSPATAWRNARVSVSRWAVPSHAASTASWSVGKGAPLEMGSPDTIIAKRSARVQPLAPPVAIDDTGQTVAVSITAANVISHRCKLIPLKAGDQT